MNKKFWLKMAWIMSAVLILCAAPSFARGGDVRARIRERQQKRAEARANGTAPQRKIRDRNSAEDDECFFCFGSGTCSTCGGSGTELKWESNFKGGKLVTERVAVNCSDCHGSGKCSHCYGTGRD